MHGRPIGVGRREPSGSQNGTEAADFLGKLPAGGGFGGGGMRFAGGGFRGAGFRGGFVGPSVPGFATPESPCSSARPCSRRSWTSCHGRPSIAPSIDTAGVTRRGVSVWRGQFV